MNYFDKNISLMRNIFPQLAKKILNDKTVEYEFKKKNLQIKNTISGAATLMVDGIYVHSGRDPVRESAKLVSAALNESCNDTLITTPPKNSSVIFLGFGLGYAAIEAAKYYKNHEFTTQTFIIIEKEFSILKAALQYNDFTELFTSIQIIFVCGGNASGIIAALNEVENLKPPCFDECRRASQANTSIVVIKNIALISLDKEWYDDILKNIKLVEDKTKINTATLKRFARRWQKNIFKNLYAVRDTAGINLLFGKFNFPVLLIAAGPSLDDISPFIKDLSQRFVIVAVDTSLRFLHEKNVIPDFVFTVDPQFWNSRHMSRVLPLSIDQAHPQSSGNAILIAESSVYPSAMRDASFVFSTVFPLWKLCEDKVDVKGRLAAGGSVVTSAWDFARLINGASCPPEAAEAQISNSPNAAENQCIFIAALDLSFPSLKTHYKGALFEEIAVSASNRFATAETKSFLSLRGGAAYYAPCRGGTYTTVLTDKRLSLYASWFENKFSQYTNIKNYSLTSGSEKECGLFIKGLKNIFVEDLLAMPIIRSDIEKTKQKVLDEINTQWNNGENKQLRSKKYNDFINTIINVLEKTKVDLEKKQLNGLHFKIDIKDNYVLQAIFFSRSELKDTEFITKDNYILVLDEIDFVVRLAQQIISRGHL
ncbi:MAG: DUF115 domain-containing protein [Termitinemataceae bacterium]|nr:MAG: DUF115 domain-containing protein [Termitinemataceae bacterium]